MDPLEFFPPRHPSTSSHGPRTQSAARRPSLNEQKKLNRLSSGCNYVRGFANPLYPFEEAVMPGGDMSSIAVKQLPKSTQRHGVSCTLGSKSLTASDPPSSGDIQNFAGSVNPLGCKGHTLTTDSYGPQYASRSPRLERNSDESAMQSKGRRAAPVRSTQPLKEVSTSSISFSEDLEGGLAKTAADVGQTPWRLLQDVSLEEVGGSMYFTDGVYTIWRVLYAVLCLAGALVVWIDGPNLTFFGPAVALSYALLAALVGLCRNVQVQVGKNGVEGSRDYLTSNRRWSWYVTQMRRNSKFCAAIFHV